MKKIIALLAVIFTLSFSLTTEKAQAQSGNAFFYLVTLPMVQDTGSGGAKPGIASLHTGTLTGNDSLFYTLLGTGSKASSVKTDSLIMLIPFKNANASGIMDFGVRADSASTLDSIQVYQNNVIIYTYKTGAHFKTADVYFPFVSSGFMVNNRFTIKPILSRVSSKARKIYVNPNYYQQ